MRRLLVVALLIVGCSGSDGSADAATSSSTTTSPTMAASTTTTEPVDFAVTSPAFDDGGTIPVEYTCDGPDVSPELNIVGIPAGTESLVVIVDDPDAPLGTWDHWVEYNVETAPGSLDVARATDVVGTQGTNSWNLPGYMGPCPPTDEEHQYFFTVYAVGDLLDLPEGAESAQVYDAMEGDVIDSVQLTGRYER